MTSHPMTSPAPQALAPELATTRVVPVEFAVSRPADQARDETSVHAIWPVCEHAMTVDRLHVIPDGDVPADVEHHATLVVRVINEGGDPAVRQLASLSTADRALIAGESEWLDLSATAVPAGWTLQLVVSKAGDGVLLPTIVLAVALVEHRYTPAGGTGHPEQVEP